MLLIGKMFQGRGYRAKRGGLSLLFMGSGMNPAVRGIGSGAGMTIILLCGALGDPRFRGGPTYRDDDYFTVWGVARSPLSRG